MEHTLSSLQEYLLESTTGSRFSLAEIPGIAHRYVAIYPGSHRTSIQVLPLEQAADEALKPYFDERMTTVTIDDLSYQLAGPVPPPVSGPGFPIPVGMDRKQFLLLLNRLVSNQA